MYKCSASIFAILTLAACSAPVDDEAESDVDSISDAVTGTACTSPSTNDTNATTNINQIRTSLGNSMGAINCNNNIRTGAQRHGLYQGSNNIMTHTEVSGNLNFYAANFWDRMSLAGYTGAAKWEGISGYGDATSAINQWMDSALHRAPFMDYTVAAFGFGNGTVSGTAKFATIDWGGGGVVPTTASYAIWPVNNATNVRRGFNCTLEGPAPCTSATAGYPIMLSTSQVLSVTTHTLTVDATGTIVTHTWIPYTTDTTQPGAYISNTQAVMIPTATLAASTKYRINLVGTNGGTSFNKTYYFTTGTSI